MFRQLRFPVNMYWLCQVTGWLAMVLIEMINYSFFIVKQFRAEVLYVFMACALVGILLTHVYRKLISRRNIFNSSLSYIWTQAFFSTFIISFVMTVLTEIPLILRNQQGLGAISFIGIAGATINWMRYVGVWIIIYFLYKILELNTSIVKEKLELENLAKTTELELLKSQLNPHFLFNALNAIKALVILNPDQSRQAIVKLSELLRYTLNYGKNQLVSFEEELAEVKKYLELEKLRFAERLEVLFEIEAAMLHKKFPPALLLTVVENAVKHGIASQASNGQIIIKTLVKNNGFEVSVANTGVYRPGKAEGIGLAQIQKRLAALYHEKARFMICNTNGWVIATIHIEN